MFLILILVSIWDDLAGQLRSQYRWYAIYVRISRNLSLHLINPNQKVTIV